ncbi:hypothetical protein DICVIV_00313 [Dictyocaulus viviparus]|uniref:Uncharacterized protein n=1 Tax=Dictyocaulus viviparus TaxID=29172 RepID=A0A0D8Y9N8_DICVI|nr:hypothetical protein DICVIV_00313 [Dictyocaulus viviparus]
MDCGLWCVFSERRRHIERLWRRRLLVTSDERRARRRNRIEHKKEESIGRLFAKSLKDLLFLFCLYFHAGQKNRKFTCIIWNEIHKREALEDIGEVRSSLYRGRFRGKLSTCSSSKNASTDHKIIT